jgi:molybdate transport system permease protein
LRITLPLALPGIAAGVVLAFARGLGEFGATTIVAGNMEGRTRTIALAIYALLDAPGDDPRVTMLVGASVALCVAALVGYEALGRWQRRRIDLDAR